jgi:thiol:disulfide interchange protein
MPKMLGPIMNLSLRTILLCLALFANPASATSDSPFGQEPKDVLASSSNNTVNTFSSGPEFVPVEQAYQFSLVVEPQQLVFNWEIRDGYYLYRDRFDFRSFDSNLELQAPIFDSGLVKWDEFFEKDLEVYYSQTTVRLPFTATDDILHLQIESQGCADAGLCYPPYKQWLEIDLQTGAVDISTQPPEQMQDIKETISLPVVLLFALLGGIILNLMP